MTITAVVDALAPIPDHSITREKERGVFLRGKNENKTMYSKSTRVR